MLKWFCMGKQEMSQLSRVCPSAHFTIKQWAVGFCLLTDWVPDNVILASRFLEISILNDANWKLTSKIFNGSLLEKWMHCPCLLHALDRPTKEPNPPPPKVLIIFHLEVAFDLKIEWNIFFCNKDSIIERKILLIENFPYTLFSFNLFSLFSSSPSSLSPPFPFWWDSKWE